MILINCQILTVIQYSKLQLECQWVINNSSVFPLFSMNYGQIIYKRHNLCYIGVNLKKHTRNLFLSSLVAILRNRDTKFMTQIIKQELLSFSGLGLEPKMLDIIRQIGFTVPTPIQLKSIPVIGEGKDMVGIAQTGTGKTLAFGLPILQRLARYKGRCLILVPTRELASQVNDHLKIIAQKLDLKTVVLIGGESKYPQMKLLQRRPELIIATPGRLIDFLESKTFNLNEVKSLVLDEADLMFDMGFAPQLNKILKLAPKEKQTILFSATMPASIMEIATRHMTLPVRIEVAPAGTPAENVLQEVIILHKEDRTVQLQKILAQYHGSVLIFVRTKSSVKNICRAITSMNHTVTEIHSNRTLVQRTRALRGFKEGQFRILVATDIAARGIDVKGIELVLNYDLPDNIEDYIHRIGRTGRAGKMGQAVSFATPSQISAIRRIEKMIKKEIPLTKLATIKNEGGNFSRDNRQSGFSTFGGYRKNNHKPVHQNYHKKWPEKKSTTGYQSDYDRFKKGKAGLSDNNYNQKAKYFDKYKKNKPTGNFHHINGAGSMPTGGGDYKPNRPFNDYKKSQSTARHFTKKPNNFSSSNSTDQKTSSFNRTKSYRPFKKRGATKFRGKRDFHKAR